jgi:hypothetical protein
MPTVRLENFKGINNRAEKEHLDPSWLKECDNFNIDNNGLLRQREGFVYSYSGIVKSLWSDNVRCFGTVDETLTTGQIKLAEFTFDIAGNVVKSDLANVSDTNLDFDYADGAYYFVGQHSKGKISGTTVKSLGIDRITASPTLTAISGSMTAGRYIVAITHIDANGVESGTGAFVAIELAASKSILLSNIPVSANSRVTHSVIYVSQVNGTELFRNGKVTNGTTTYTITTVANDVIPLTTSNLSSAAYGSIIKYFFGRLYIASDNVIYYSQPKRYEQWDLREYLHYAENVTCILPCTDGMWISADGLYWISGRNPAEFVQAKKSELKIYSQQSASLIPDHHLNVEGYAGYAWSVTCPDGVVILGNDGFFYAASRQIYNLPTGTTDAVGVQVEHTDSYQYVAFLQPVDLIAWNPGDVTMMNADIEIPFSWGDASPVTIINVPAGKTVFTVQIALQTAFNGAGVVLTVGDSGDHSRLMTAGQNNPYEAAIYESNPVYLYSGLTTINLYITVDGSNTQGSGTILIEMKD